jgi:hypothetical protein
VRLWVPEATGSVYASKEELAEAVVAILCAEVAEAAAAGAAVIQLDEPVLTELVFTQGQTRTFMCAALASRKDPAEELEFAVGLINRVAQAINEAGATSALHVCRGNWSTREETLLAGSYRPLEPVFARLCVRQLVLEYATPRAGDLLCFDEQKPGAGSREPADTGRGAGGIHPGTCGGGPGCIQPGAAVSQSGLRIRLLQRKANERPHHRPGQGGSPCGSRPGVAPPTGSFLMQRFREHTRFVLITEPEPGFPAWCQLSC